MLNALRLTHGFTIELYQQHTGLPLSSVTATLQQAVSKGWLSWQGDNIRPTEEGQRLHNDLVSLFLPA
jgi:coproporphyrinogen III oxidase-like Fe-S oxidoreductase